MRALPALPARRWPATRAPVPPGRILLEPAASRRLRPIGPVTECRAIATAPASISSCYYTRTLPCSTSTRPSSSPSPAAAGGWCPARSPQAAGLPVATVRTVLQALATEGRVHRDLPSLAVHRRQDLHRSVAEARTHNLTRGRGRPDDAVSVGAGCGGVSGRQGVSVWSRGQTAPAGRSRRPLT